MNNECELLLPPVTVYAFILSPHKTTHTTSGECGAPPPPAPPHPEDDRQNKQGLQCFYSNTGRARKENYSLRLDRGSQEKENALQDGIVVVLF